MHQPIFPETQATLFYLSGTVYMRKAAMFLVSGKAQFHVLLRMLLR